MTLADFSLTLFALLNGGRILAYIPQMIRICRDPHDAAAVSVATWTLFTAANIATVCYALVVADDRLVAIVFALNAVGCLGIVAMTMFKRNSWARRAPVIRHRLAPPLHLRRCDGASGAPDKMAAPTFAAPRRTPHRHDEIARARQIY